MGEPGVVSLMAFTEGRHTRPEVRSMTYFRVAASVSAVGAARLVILLVAMFRAPVADTVPSALR